MGVTSHVVVSRVSSQQSVRGIKTHEQPSILVMDGSNITWPQLHSKRKRKQPSKDELYALQVFSTYYLALYPSLAMF